jgi:hypothetical protein
MCEFLLTRRADTIKLLVVVAKNKLLVAADIFGETSFQYLDNN